MRNRFFTLISPPNREAREGAGHPLGRDYRLVEREREKKQRRLLDDDLRRRAAWGIGAGDLLPDPGRHPAEDERVRVVGLGDGDRRSAVGGLADPDCRAVPR